MTSKPDTLARALIHSAEYLARLNAYDPELLACRLVISVEGAVIEIVTTSRLASRKVVEWEFLEGIYPTTILTKAVEEAYSDALHLAKLSKEIDTAVEIERQKGKEI